MRNYPIEYHRAFSQEALFKEQGKQDRERMEIQLTRNNTAPLTIPAQKRILTAALVSAETHTTGAPNLAPASLVDQYLTASIGL